jgi:hypothetical protein
MFATSNVFNIAAINSQVIRSVVNLKRMNDIHNVSEFLAAMNRKLPYDGLYIGCDETVEQRRNRIYNKYHKSIYHPYYLLDFMVKRVFPKLGPRVRLISF